MLSRALDLVLAALALLGPFAIHLFFPVIPVIKVDFQLTDALAQLAFSIGVFGMAFSPTGRSRTATDAARYC
jgi:MFS transporter, DHA1 family, multidrug resistance protein